MHAADDRGKKRGYTEDCDLNGKLQRVTAACGPVIYRGDNFPEEFRGNAFVCEPAGNLVVRHVLKETGVAIAVVNTTFANNLAQGGSAFGGNGGDAHGGAINDSSLENTLRLVNVTIAAKCPPADPPITPI